jgi:hypothetical protein
MLNNDDRSAIEGLFHRLKDVERKAEPRDPEAEDLINREIVRQPGAPYYMAQTILVQEHALQVAERRIQELENEARQQDRGSDIFGGLFGGGRQNQRQRGYEPYQDDRGSQGGPWDRRQQGRNDRYDDNRGGGGFLAGAAQTALGVTGGVLIGSAIASMFGGGGAHAAEAPQDQQPADDSNSDNGNDAGGGNDDFGGGGFDDGGGFDMGGDF